MPEVPVPHRLKRWGTGF